MQFQRGESAAGASTTLWQYAGASCTGGTCDNQDEAVSSRQWRQRVIQRSVGVKAASLGPYRQCVHCGLQSGLSLIARLSRRRRSVQQTSSAVEAEKMKLGPPNAGRSSSTGREFDVRENHRCTTHALEWEERQKSRGAKLWLHVRASVARTSMSRVTVSNWMSWQHRDLLLVFEGHLVATRVMKAM